MRRTFAMEFHRLLANGLHFLKRIVAALRANHVTQDATELPRVDFERGFFVVGGGVLGGGNSVHRTIIV